VNIIARTPEQEILLVRQFRYGTKRMELEIPGGMIDPGEDPVAAGCRELLEETGFAGENGTIIGSVRPNPAIQGNICYTILVKNAVLSARPHPDDMEEIDWFYVPEHDIEGYIRDGLIEHGLVLNALSHYERYKKG
jgi:8-oxo-dGTP pyrophosphatase MutT (NUDIX family)